LLFEEINIPLKQYILLLKHFIGYSVLLCKNEERSGTMNGYFRTFSEVDILNGTQTCKHRQRVSTLKKWRKKSSGGLYGDMFFAYPPHSLKLTNIRLRFSREYDIIHGKIETYNEPIIEGSVVGKFDMKEKFPF